MLTLREFKPKNRSTKSNLLNQLEHITLHDNNIRYHFNDEATANQLLKSLERQLKSKGIASAKKVQRYRCLHASQHCRCFTVSLTPTAFDYFHGKNTFNYLNKYLAEPIVSSRQPLDIHIIYHLALIVGSAAKTLFFKKLFHQMDPDDCNILATISLNDKNIIQIFMENLPIEVLSPFIHKLTYPTCFKLLSSNMPEKYLMLLVHNLDEENCTKIIQKASLDEGVERNLLQTLFSNVQSTLFFFAKVNPHMLIHLLSKNTHLHFPELNKTDILLCRSIHNMMNNPQNIHDSSQDLMNDSGELLRRQLLLIPPIVKQNSTINLLTKFSEAKVNTEPRITPAQTLLNDMKMTTVVGRNIIFMHSNGKIQVLKIQTKFESMEGILQDFKALSYLNKHAKDLDLKSNFPIPIAVLQVKELSQTLKSFLSPDKYHRLILQIEKRSKHGACLYEYTNKSYQSLRQLYQLSVTHQDYQEANTKIIHDLFTLLKNGLIYPQLLSLKRSGRQTNIAISVLDDIFNLKKVNASNQYLRAPGSLPWKKRIENSQLTLLGLGSFVDIISLNELIGNSAKIKMLYKNLIDIPKDRVINYILVESIAAYQYTLFLLAGKRGSEFTKQAKKRLASEKDIHQIWERLANQLVRNSAQAIALLTHFTYQQAYDFMNTVIDTERLANQMHYWMTNEHIVDIKQHTIKSDLYAASDDVQVNFKRFNQKLNASRTKDVLRFIGKDPVTEARKLMLWSSNLILASYNNTRLTLEDLHKVLHEKDFQTSEQLRKNSFLHLNGKFFHKLQKNLCEMRLLEPGLPKSIRQELKKESEYHKLQHTSFVITNFFRKAKHKSLRPGDEEEKSVHLKY